MTVRATDPLLLIVVGAHLRAEAEDRALAQHLCDRVQKRAWERGLDTTPIVVTDLWQLNEPDLARKPRITVGPPQHNAATAALTGSLPSVFAIDEELLVQLDPELVEPVACCWGRGPAQTKRACDHFADKWLDAFLDAAERQAA